MDLLVVSVVSTLAPPAHLQPNAIPATLHIKDNSHQFQPIASVLIGTLTQDLRLVHLAIPLALDVLEVPPLALLAIAQFIGH